MADTAVFSDLEKTFITIRGARARIENDQQFT
jgi:hypothetical protein